MPKGAKKSGKSAGKKPLDARTQEEIGRKLREVFRDGPVREPVPDRFNEMLERIGKLERSASPLQGSPSTPPPRKPKE